MLDRLYRELESNYDEIVAWRRHLHQHPELSFEETNTSAFIAEQLKSFDIEVKTGVGGNGVLGYLSGGQPGRTIALRADFDALPIQDEKEAPYKSTVPGVMHACGHDGHTATLLGVARVLSKHRSVLKGNLVFIFQHAEEKPPGGAKSIIETGLLDPVDVIYGVHLSSEIPLGRIGLKEGPAMAAVDAFTIKIQGRGGHGARPHTTVDSIVIGSQIVSGLQQIVSRRIDPIHSAVVTVGIFQSGTAFNVIADKARIEGTVRTFDKQVRQQIEQEIRLIVKGIAESAHAEYDIDYLNGYPPLVNAKAETERVRGLIGEIYGPETFLELQPVMGAEDFAYYLEKKPGAFIQVGARNEDEKTQYPHHHPRFDFDERGMLHSARVFLGLVLDYLYD